MIATILISIYLLSAYFLWRWIHLAHSKGGIYYGLNTDSDDLIVVFFPLVNTAIVFMCWIKEYPIKEKNKLSKPKYNKFFKIKTK